MPGLFLVNAQDVARSLGPDPKRITVQGVYDRLADEYLRRRGGGFNHDPSIRVIHDVFRGASTVAQGKAFCLQNGNPKGREQNAQIVSVVGPYAEANISRCHRIGYVAIAIGRYKSLTIFIGLKAPFVRVPEPSRAMLVIPGFRKVTRPVGWQIEFVCSVAANQLARDDYEGADVEYLSAGPAPIGTGRVFQAMHGSDMALLSSDGVDQYMQMYLEAVVKHLEKGNGAQPAKFAGYRIIDPTAGRLF
jgi:hypothetical protein